MSVADYNFNSMRLGDSVGHWQKYSFAEYQAARQAIEGATVKIPGYGPCVSEISEETRKTALRALSCFEITLRAPAIIPNPNGTLSFGWETDQGYGQMDIDREACRLFIKSNNSVAIEYHGEISAVIPVGWTIDALLYPYLSSPLAHVRSGLCWPEATYRTGYYQGFNNVFSESIAQASFEASKNVTSKWPARIDIDDIYSIAEPDVRVFIEEHHLTEVLIQANRPLESAFGPAVEKTLALVEGDEGEQTLFCLVMISGSMQEARKALKSFDDDWWISESLNLGGKLNFDFELI